MASLFTAGKFTALSASGVVPGAKLYTYAAGTTTPLATYTLQDGASPNANPVICNASGQASVWLGTSAYRFILKDASDVTIWDVDNYTASSSEHVSFLAAGSGAVATTVRAKLRAIVSPEDFGAVGDGVTDDTAAINLALAASDLVIGTGSYVATGTITIPRTGVTLDLRKLLVAVPVKIPTAENSILRLQHFGVTNAFVSGTNMLELGASGDTARQYGFQLDVDYCTGRTPAAVTVAHVVRNYNCTFSDLRLNRVYNTKNVYTCDAPACALGDNRMHGTLIENCDYAMFLHGTTGSANHVEHHVLDYQFVAGAQYGALYARGRAHYQVMNGAYDFNGQSLVKLTMTGSTVTENIGVQVQGTSSSAFGTIKAVTSDSMLLSKDSGTFTTSDGINGKPVTAVVVYGSGGPYLDFISNTDSSFARHTLNCSFLTNVYGNNQEDWIKFSALSSSNQRAEIAGHAFIASTGEQYMSLNKDTYSIRYGANSVLAAAPTAFSLRTTNGTVVLQTASTGYELADNLGNKLIEWNTTDGLELGQWSGAQIIKANRNVQFLNGTWDTPHILLGTTHLWVNAGKLMINTVAPTSAADGTVVGTQT